MNQKKAKRLRRAFKQAGFTAPAVVVNGTPVVTRKLYQKAKGLSTLNQAKLASKLEEGRRRSE